MSDSEDMSERRSRPCATCGEPMEYQGKSTDSAADATEVGGELVCPNGHVEPVVPE